MRQHVGDEETMDSGWYDLNDDVENERVEQTTTSRLILEVWHGDGYADLLVYDGQPNFGDEALDTRFPTVEQAKVCAAAIARDEMVTPAWVRT